MKTGAGSGGGPDAPSAGSPPAGAHATSPRAGDGARCGRTRPASGTRVLLVHANPFQRALPVPAYGLERIATAARLTGAQVEILDPYLTARDPLAAAIAAARSFRPHVVGLSVRIIDDCITVDGDHDGIGDIDVSFFLPEIRRLRDALVHAAPDAHFVVGGAAFSYLPLEILEYLELPLGVAGPGEHTFAELVRTVADGRPMSTVAGLIRRGDSTFTRAITGAPPTPAVTREDRWAPVNAFPVRTRVGCAMECSYCLTANLGRATRNEDVESVLDEVQERVEAARHRGLDRVSVFFADDEFNLPEEGHAIAVLRGLLRRGLQRHIDWRAYFNPVPFGDELACLVRQTNGIASFTVDSAADAVLARNRKPLRRKGLDRMMEQVLRHGVPSDLGLIFGMPGETQQTIDETVRWLRRVPAHVDATYAVGARVYPHTPLADHARAEPDRLVGASDPSFLAPVVYCSPVAPRDLADQLARAFGDRPHIRLVGGGYVTASRAVSAAYRVIAEGGGRTEWEAALRLARSDLHGRTSLQTLTGCLQVAVWAGRLDLAAQTHWTLARDSTPLPAGLRRAHLAAAALVYRAAHSHASRAASPVQRHTQGVKT